MSQEYKGARPRGETCLASNKVEGGIEQGNNITMLCTNNANTKSHIIIEQLKCISCASNKTIYHISLRLNMEFCEDIT